jgi:Ni,Fe-hydrogenase III small subunit/NAD-dependent dihydropyrimidine dehydrogenase PreA subunit
MLRELKILHSHGKQYVPDLTRVELTPLFRGRPVIHPDITAAEQELVARLCPASAVLRDDFGIDLGKCMFCKECAFACPDKIRFTSDHKIASNDRNSLIIRRGDRPVGFDESRIDKKLRKLFKRSLKLRQVSAGGDNSCEMELNAAGNVNFDMGRYGIEFVASPRHADGIVITGPITQNMAEALQICYDAVPSPKIVILVGTDAISGGLFSNSDAVDRNFLEKFPVDLYVPGNPAHPLTFINGILKWLGR